MTDAKPWSQMHPHELLDMAQSAFDHSTPEATMALISAAQVQALLLVDWTLTERVAASMGRMP